MWKRKEITYDRTIKVGELVTMAQPGVFVLERIEPREGGYNPLFISRKILDGNGKARQDGCDCCDASFCHRVTADFLAKKQQQDVEEATQAAHERYERMSKLLVTGYTLREIKAPPKIHKVLLQSLYFGQPVKEFSSTEIVFCGVRVSPENHSECWADVNCKNCLRDYEKSVTPKSLVSEMWASTRVRNLLGSMGLVTLLDVSKKTEQELSRRREFGETSIRTTKQVLETAGLQLRK